MEHTHVSSLAALIQEARARTLALVADLGGIQLIGPLLPTLNPLLWEIGHVAWFQEKWVLRHHLGRPALRDDADDLYDSAAIPHDTRWDLHLPSHEETLDYLVSVARTVVRSLQTPPSFRVSDPYFYWLTLFHEDMHAEAITYTRQTLGYPPPFKVRLPEPVDEGEPLPGDVEIPGGDFLLGGTPDQGFVFDNEKWAHPVRVAPFAMARAPVTNAAFAAFVDDGGYGRKDLWSEAGWRWREEANADHPLYWKRLEGGSWQRRIFDQTVPLSPHHPVIHVNWYEADAYCRWAGRRLPSEAEWELAASAQPGGPGFTVEKRRYPWGDDPPNSKRANLDWRAMGTVPVNAMSGGDSAFGCRQMMGNVWEWTATEFGPYPGFEPDPYEEYSQPWFGDHLVLRGGCWATRSRLIRNTWRNFYQPHRRDVWAGFRTCRSTA